MILVKTFASLLLSTLGKMAVQYIMSEAVIEKLILYGLEKLVASTDSQVDNEILALLKEKMEKSDV